MTDESEWEDYDTELDPEDVLGTNTFEDVLYTGEIDLVDVGTGETPAELDRSVEEAKQFAADAGVTDTPKVAKRSGREAAVETRSPYSACAFFHFSITGGMDWHQAYRAAHELDEFDVTFDADYETGDLTVTVKRAGE